jgi:mono/diheme cytochrome c family protein
MKRTATNITWNGARITWLGGLAFILLLVGTVGAGCSAQDASASVTDGEQAARIKRGAYLVTIGGCNDCHTPWKMGPNGPEPDASRLLSGHPESYSITAPAKPPGGEWQNAAVMGATNTAFSGPWGVSFTANLTPEPNTGIGIWTEEMFIKTLRTGRHWGVSRPILPPMPWFNYGKMTDEDLKAVFAYLRSIPPVVNHVPTPIPPVEATN